MILTRRREDLRRELSYKDIEVRAVTSAIHAAANNKAGAEQAMKFEFPKPSDGKKPAEKRADPGQVARMFGGTAPAFTQEDIAALAAQRKEADQ